MDSKTEEEDLAGADCQFGFVEETLQITDVHMNLENSATFQEDTSTLETPLESSFSINKFVKLSPDDSTAQSTSGETLNLQSELASLGFTPFGNLNADITDHEISVPCDDVKDNLNASSSECSEDEFIEAVDSPDSIESNSQNVILNQVNTSIEYSRNEVSTNESINTNREDSVTGLIITSTTEDEDSTHNGLTEKDFEVCDEDEFEDADDTDMFLPLVDNCDGNETPALGGDSVMETTKGEDTVSVNNCKDTSVENYSFSGSNINLEPFLNIEMANDSLLLNDRSTSFGLCEVQFFQNSSHNLSREMLELSAVLKLDDPQCNLTVENDQVKSVEPVHQLEKSTSSETCTLRGNSNRASPVSYNEKETVPEHVENPEEPKNCSLFAAENSFALQDVHFLQDVHRQLEGCGDFKLGSFVDKEEICEETLTKSYSNGNEEVCSPKDVILPNTPEDENFFGTVNSESSSQGTCVTPCINVNLNETETPETAIANSLYKVNVTIPVINDKTAAVELSILEESVAFAENIISTSLVGNAMCDEPTTETHYLSSEEHLLQENSLLSKEEAHTTNDSTEDCASSQNTIPEINEDNTQCKEEDELTSTENMSPKSMCQEQIPPESENVQLLDNTLTEDNKPSLVVNAYILESKLDEANKALPENHILTIDETTAANHEAKEETPSNTEAEEVLLNVQDILNNSAKDIYEDNTQCKEEDELTSTENLSPNNKSMCQEQILPESENVQLLDNTFTEDNKPSLEVNADILESKLDEADKALPENNVLTIDGTTAANNEVKEDTPSNTEAEEVLLNVQDILNHSAKEIYEDNTQCKEEDELTSTENLSPNNKSMCQEQILPESENVQLLDNTFTEDNKPSLEVNADILESKLDEADKALPENNVLTIDGTTAANNEVKEDTPSNTEAEEVLLNVQDVLNRSAKEIHEYNTQCKEEDELTSTENMSPNNKSMCQEQIPPESENVQLLDNTLTEDNKPCLVVNADILESKLDEADKALPENNILTIDDTTAANNEVKKDTPSNTEAEEVPLNVQDVLNHSAKEIHEDNTQCKEEDELTSTENMSPNNKSMCQEQIPPESENVQLLDNTLTEDNKLCLVVNADILESKLDEADKALPENNVLTIDETTAANNEVKEETPSNTVAEEVLLNVPDVLNHSAKQIQHRSSDPMLLAEGEESKINSDLMTNSPKGLSLLKTSSADLQCFSHEENIRLPVSECNNKVTFGRSCENQESDKTEFILQDMSMTLTSNVCNLSLLDDDFHENGVDSSFVKSNKSINLKGEVSSCDTIDFVQNLSVKEINSFSDDENQHKFEGAYTFVNDLKDISCNQTVFDNGMQCMEITMANINPVLCENSITLNSTAAPKHFPQSSSEESDMEQSQTTYLSPQSFDQGSVQKESHELMQQSMSEYVTNRSLHLTIPDSNEPADVRETNDEVCRQQCELQTEQVLLMKWPAEYHEKLKSISEENQKLSEQIECMKNKDIKIQNLQQENKNLVETMREINKQFENLKENNKTLEENFAIQNAENNNTIDDLRKENSTLLADIKHLRTLELQLEDLKDGNAILQKSIENINKKKDDEIKGLTDKVKILEQDLTAYNDTIHKLQKENEELSKISAENDTKTKEVTSERDNLQEVADGLSQQAEELKQLQQENEELKSSLERVRETIQSERDTELDNLKMALKDLKEQNDLLWHQLSSCSCLDTERKKDQLIQEKMAHLQAEVAEVCKLKVENQQLLKLIESKNEDLSKLTADKKKLKSTLLKINSKLNSLESDNEQLFDENKELSLRLEDINSESSLLNETIARLQTENSALQKELLEMQDSLNPISEHISSLLIERDFLADQMKSGEVNNEALTQNLSLLQNENHHLKLNLESLQDNLKVVESECRELMNGLSSMGEAVHSLLEENMLKEHSRTKENDQKINQLVCERELLSKEITVMKEQIQKLEDLNSSLVLQLESLQNTSQVFETERNDLMESLSSLSESLQSVFEENIILNEQKCAAENENKQIESLVCQNNQLSQETVNVKQQIQQLENTHTALVGEKSNEIESLQDVVREMEKQVSSLSEELMSEMFKYDSVLIEKEDMVKAVTEEKNKIQTELSTVFQKLSDLEAVDEIHKKEIELHEAAKLQHEEALNVVSTKLELASTSFLNIQLKNEDLKSEMYRIREAANNLENTNETLINQIKSDSLEIKRLSKQLEDGKCMISELLIEKTSLYSDVENKAGLVKELQDLIRELETHISSLNEELMSEIAKTHFMEEDQLTFKQQISNTTEEKQNLQHLLETTVQRLTNLESENASLSKIHEKMVKLEQVCQTLEETKQEQDSTISMLREKEIEMEKQHQLDAAKVQRAETLAQEISSKNETLVDTDNLRQTLVKEIKSLVGGDNSENFEIYSITDIFQKFMTEFLSKEKEVISALQSDFEVRFKAKLEEAADLQRKLYEKEEDIAGLEKACEKVSEELNSQKQTSLNLESECQIVKLELSSREEEILSLKELMTTIENQKKECVENLKKGQADLVLELDDKLKFMNDEIMCKDDEISKLANEIESFKRKESELSLEEKQTTVKIEELNSQIVQEKINASNLTSELQSKNSELEQLMAFVETKNKELAEYEKNVDEMSKKLCCFEKEISLVNQLLASANEVNSQTLLKSVEQCYYLRNILQKIAQDWELSSKTLELKLASLDADLKNRLEAHRTLETQINCLNEELKSHKLLYDEDILQLKEEVTLKGETIEALKGEIAVLKIEKADVMGKPDSEEFNKTKKALEQLKEENLKLKEGVSQFNVFKEVNRKLSLEMEELQRSINKEKENNYALKAKCDSAANQILDLEKLNFQLEDKIDTIENQLRNQNVLSAIQIKFPYEINSVDKQVVFINERLSEFEKVKHDLDVLLEEHQMLKSESEKAKEFIKRQEEKISKVLKRELDLKKQIASSSAVSSNESKLLQKIKSELFSFYPDLPLQENIVKIRQVLEESKRTGSLPNQEDLRKQLEEALQENKELDNECDMMNKHIKEQEKDLISALNREEKLIKENKELKSKDTKGSGSFDSLEELFRVFPIRPTSLDQALEIVKHSLAENETLKEKVTEAEEEWTSLNKECDDMLAQYQAKEEELVEVLKREAEQVAEMKSKENELETRINSLSKELQEKAMKEQTVPSGPCECNELKSRLSELRIEVAERSAKITSLELQIEADNFPIKKKTADLEKSLEQSKQKISELKAEVRRYQTQMHEVTVGMRLECENCRRGNSTQSSELSELQEQLAKRDKDIAILKALCKSRNQRISELEQAADMKTPRVLRSALKEVNENLTTPLSPTKKPKNAK